MVEDRAEGDHAGVVGAEGGWADLQGALMVGTGAGQIAEVDEHGAEGCRAEWPSRAVGTVGGRVDVQPPSWLWLCDSEGPGT